MAPPCPVLSLRSPFRRHQILERLPAADDATFVSLHQDLWGTPARPIEEVWFRPHSLNFNDRLEAQHKTGEIPIGHFPKLNV